MLVFTTCPKFSWQLQARSQRGRWDPEGVMGSRRDGVEMGSGGSDGVWEGWGSSGIQKEHGIWEGWESDGMWEEQWDLGGMGQ